MEETIVIERDQATFGLRFREQVLSVRPCWKPVTPPEIGRETVKQTEREKDEVRGDCPKGGSHYVIVDGKEWSRHNDVKIAEQVRDEIPVSELQRAKKVSVAAGRDRD